MKHKVYQITNKLNCKIYIGVTEDTLKNRFKGHANSDSHLGDSIRKYSKSQFEIVEIFAYNTKEESYAKENEIVTEEFIKRKDTYNLKVGGIGGWGYVNENNLQYKFSKEDIIKAANTNRNSVVVKTKEGHIRVSSEEFATGEYEHNTKGMVAVSINGETTSISKEDFDSGNFVGVAKGTVAVEIISTGVKTRVPSEDYHNNKDLYKSLGSLPGNKNGMALKIFVYNKDDVLIFESHGDFVQKCEEYNLEMYLLKKSYQTNKKIDSKKARKQSNRELDGWYAVKS